MEKNYANTAPYDKYHRHIIRVKHSTSFFDNNLIGNILNNINLQQIIEIEKLSQYSLLISSQNLKKDWYNKQYKKNKIKLIKLFQCANKFLQSSIKSKKQQLKHLQLVAKHRQFKIYQRENNLITVKLKLMKYEDQYTNLKLSLNQESRKYQQHLKVSNLSIKPEVFNIQNNNSENENLIEFIINKNDELLDKLLNKKKLNYEQEKYGQIIKIINKQKQQIVMLKQKIIKLQKIQNQQEDISIKLIKNICQKYSNNFQKQLFKNLKNLLQNAENQNNQKKTQKICIKIQKGIKQIQQNKLNIIQQNKTQAKDNSTISKNSFQVNINFKNLEHLHQNINNIFEKSSLQIESKNSSELGKELNINTNHKKTTFLQSVDCSMIDSLDSSKNFKLDNSSLGISNISKDNNYTLDEAYLLSPQSVQDLSDIKQPVQEVEVINKATQNNIKYYPKYSISINQKYPINYVIQEQECQESSKINASYKEMTQSYDINKLNMVNSILIVQKYEQESTNKQQQEKQKVSQYQSGVHNQKKQSEQSEQNLFQQ